MTAAMDRFDLIRAGLRQLNPADDAHWTNGGLPRLDVVRAKIGIDDVTRVDVNEAMPHLMRETAVEAPADVQADAQMTSAPAVGQKPVNTLEDEKAVCMAEIDKVMQEIDQARKERNALDQKITELNSKHTLLGYAFQALFPRVRPEEAVKAYQAKSQQARAKQSADRSLLDRAMKEKRAFGLDRPEPFLLEKT